MGRWGRAQRAAEERVAAAQQERDQAVSAARDRADDAESRAQAAEQSAARVQQAAQSARADRDRMDRQLAQLREDAGRQQAELQRRSRRSSRRRRTRAPSCRLGPSGLRLSCSVPALAENRPPGKPLQDRPEVRRAAAGRTPRTRQDPGTEPGGRDRKDGEPN
jgi:hypothetical protein